LFPPQNHEKNGVWKIFNFEQVSLKLGVVKAARPFYYLCMVHAHFLNAKLRVS